MKLFATSILVLVLSLSSSLLALGDVQESRGQFVNVEAANFNSDSQIHNLSGLDIQRKNPVTRAFADTVHKESGIKYWYSDNDRLKIQLSLSDDQSVDIGVFNILGKKIKDLDHKSLSEGDSDIFEYSLSDIPNGVYIVAVQGSNFRSAIRIVISR